MSDVEFTGSWTVAFGDSLAMSDSKPREEEQVADERFQTATVEQEVLRSQTELLARACQAKTSRAKEEFVNNFLQLLHNIEFEFGYKTPADDYVEDALDRYGPFAREWLNELFLQNLEDSQVLSAILRVIAHFDYSQMYPQGTTMAIAATRHDNVEVQECGVRCFENWESPEAIVMLKSLKFTESWLNDYLQNVIMDIESLGAECLS